MRIKESVLTIHTKAEHHRPEHERELVETNCKTRTDHWFGKQSKKDLNLEKFTDLSATPILASEVGTRLGTKFGPRGWV